MSANFWESQFEKDVERQIEHAQACGVTLAERAGVWYVTEPGAKYHTGQAGSRQDAARLAFALALAYHGGRPGALRE